MRKNAITAGWVMGTILLVYALGSAAVLAISSFAQATTPVRSTNHAGYGNGWDSFRMVVGGQTRTILRHRASAETFVEIPSAPIVAPAPIPKTGTPSPSLQVAD